MRRIALLDKPLDYNLRMERQTPPDEHGVFQSWVATFEAPNRIRYLVNLEIDAGHKQVITDVSFAQRSVDPQTSRTYLDNKVMNTGDQYAVFSTVYAIIVDLYKQIKQKFDNGQNKFMITFTGDQKEMSRIKLYDALCRNLAPKFGGTYEYEDGFFYIIVPPSGKSND